MLNGKRLKLLGATTIAWLATEGHKDPNSTEPLNQGPLVSTFLSNYRAMSLHSDHVSLFIRTGGVLELTVDSRAYVYIRGCLL